MVTMETYGYARVSTREQNEARQLDAFQKLGIKEKNVYLDKLSGKDFNRPAYKAMIRKLKSQDVLYIYSIDRLGRDYEEIQQQWRAITKDLGADIVVIDMPMLDTRKGKDLMGTFIADLVLQILSFVAENERQNIKDRQQAGIASAKTRGVKFGRPSAELPEDFESLIMDWRTGKVTRPELLELLHISKTTLYRYLHKLKDEQDQQEELKLEDQENAEL